jgi:hypothetical protein
MTESVFDRKTIGVIPIGITKKLSISSAAAVWRRIILLTVTSPHSSQSRVIKVHCCNLEIHEIQDAEILPLLHADIDSTRLPNNL